MKCKKFVVIFSAVELVVFHIRCGSGKNGENSDKFGCLLITYAWQRRNAVTVLVFD